jgi:hypothetical protein
MLIKLPTVVEIIGMGRSGCRSELGLRFLAAMVILGRVRLPCSPTRPGYSRSEQSIACARDEMLKRSIQSDITKEMIYRIMRSHFPWRGTAVLPLHLPSQRHGAHSETCRSLVWMSAFRAKAEVARTLPNCRD